MASIRAIGIVEPPVILADRNNGDSYYILDGNLRVEALKELSIDTVECLLSTTDDTFTYNRRVNRLAAAQDRRMIVQAIMRGYRFIANEGMRQQFAVEPSGCKVKREKSIILREG